MAVIDAPPADEDEVLDDSDFWGQLESSVKEEDDYDEEEVEGGLLQQVGEQNELEVNAHQESYEV
jgi:hypothetical protein